MSTTNLHLGQHCPRPYNALLTVVRDGRHEPRLQLSFGEPVRHGRPGERPYYHHFTNLLLTADDARALGDELMRHAAELTAEAESQVIRIGHSTPASTPPFDSAQGTLSTGLTAGGASC